MISLQFQCWRLCALLFIIFMSPLATASPNQSAQYFSGEVPANDQTAPATPTTFYLTVAYKKITANFKIPSRLVGKDLFRGVVSFHLKENGEIFNARVLRPSGDAELDAAALQAITAANPLPPPQRKEFRELKFTYNNR